MAQSVHMHLALSVSDSLNNNFIKVSSTFAKTVENLMLTNGDETGGVFAIRIGWMTVATLSDNKPEKKEAFVSWSGDVCSEGKIVIPGCLAKDIGIFSDFSRSVNENETTFNIPPYLVSVSLVSYSPIATKVDIDPLRAEDWELLSSGDNAGFIEENLLSQICVLYPNQTFTIFAKNSPIMFQVLKIMSGGMVISTHCARLARNTEVVVAPKVRKNDDDRKEEIADDPNAFKVIKAITLTATINKALEYDTLSSHAIVTISPKTFKSLQESFKKHFHLETDTDSNLVVAAQDRIPFIFGVSKRGHIIELLKLQEVVHKGQDGSKQIQHYKNLVKRMIPCIVKVDIKLDVKDSFLHLSSLQLEKLRITDFQQVSLSACSGIELFTDSVPKVINVLHFQEILDDTSEILKLEVNKLEPNEPCLLFDRAVFETSETNEISLVKIYMPALKSTSKNKVNPPRIYLTYKENLLKMIAASKVTYSNKQRKRRKPTQILEEFPCFESQVNRIVSSVKLTSNGVPSLWYVSGKRFSGKSTLLQEIIGKLNSLDDFKCEIIQFACVTYSRSKRSIVEKKLKEIFNSIRLSKHSVVLIMDDLDVLLPKSNNNNYDQQILWLAEFIESSILELLKFSKLCIVATGKEKQTLIPKLLSVNLFNSFVEIGSFTLEQRQQILGFLFKERNLTFHGDLEDISARCDGFVAGDFVKLADRAEIHYLMRKKEDNEMSVTEDDLARAFEGFVPLGMMSTQKNFDEKGIKWNSIGGLQQSKDLLLNTIQTPLLFQRLYSLCPHKPASGVLLYGPSGCGKTLLAKSLLSAFEEIGSSVKINLIAVKGPEVLDKYIGASEQNVRDLFAKASNAAPCVLFFDEFEALAPRRGSDSTGVTDRVVNQLLTFLDGVEKTEGVYVLAASSRPDLLDPALVRPGRLDRHILVDFPSKQERIEILEKTLESEETLGYEKGVLDMIRQIENKENLLEGFSGADLVAIITTAQVSALQRLAKSKKKNEAALITVEDVKMALTDSRCSISNQERQKLARIYAKFRGERDANFDHVSGFDEGKQRIALK